MDGVHVWPLVRIDLGFQMLAVGQDWLRTPRVSAAGATKALDLARCAAASLRDPGARVGRIPEASAVFLSYPTNRQRLGERWYDRVFDPLLWLTRKPAPCD